MREIVRTMGNVESTNPKSDFRNQMAPIKLPMPESQELERRFTKVLNSMDLPPDKAKVLKNYDDEKKWDLICDQERVHAKESPSFYINKLKTYLDPKASRSSRKRKMMGDTTSTQVLRDLEISLRTNHIEWVKEFLNEENLGLDVLIDYLSFRHVIMRHEHIVLKANHEALDQMPSLTNGTLASRRPALDVDGQRMRRASKHIQKLNMGEAKDDIHVSIMCLRAIMNNKFGFSMVIGHTQAINCIALSLNHKRPRTKALVLELLAAICLVKGGHEIILNAFNNFKEVCSENRRFETLMEYFMNYEIFDIDFMVACMQFINIVVHSVEDMNFRVHLQYEFTQLGLDEYLEKFRYTESEELHVQISAYLDNVFDVAALMEDSETKSAALESVADLEEQMAQANERMVDMENEFMAKYVEMENFIQQVTAERDEIKELHNVVSEEYHTLKKAIDDKEEESKHRESLLENKIQELEKLSQTLPGRGSAKTGVSISSSATLPAAPPPPPPPPPMLGKSSVPPPPPPVPGLFRAPGAPPPPPGFMLPPGDAMTIKRKVQTKYKLPTLNWIALKPNQVKGTVFNELDDDKLFNVIDFNRFEEEFKLGTLGLNHNDDADSLQSFGSKRFKKPELVTLLEHNRLRNIAISRRKVDMPIDVVLRAINNLDLKTLPLENVEVLLRMVPTEQEAKLYREYERERKSIEVLTEEDKFLLQLCKADRLPQKLNIMSYMGNFFENIQLIMPQVHAVINASRSIKNSPKLRKLLEIILAFGNYLNSSKRGPAYGFKLQTLDMLMDMKSVDKRMTLMHFIVETIHNKFPDVAGFDSELRFLEKAATVSLENVMTDVHELEKGMELTRKEFELRKDFKDTAVLKEFLASAEDKLRRLQTDSKIAQDAFSDVVEYFGESTRTLSATTFFSMFVRFTRMFKQAELDNENRKKQERAAKEAANHPKDNVAQKNKINRKNHQDAVINELKSKTRQVKDKQLLKQDEVYNGALEDILLGLKNEPYRRADAVRRSQRRKQENVRLSRTMEELEV